MTFITGVTNPYYIRNLVHNNLLSGESFVRSPIFAHLLIYFIPIVSIYVSNHEKFLETSSIWNDSPLTISESFSIKLCIRHKCWTEMKGSILFFGSLAELCFLKSWLGIEHLAKTPTALESSLGSGKTNKMTVCPVLSVFAVHSMGSEGPKLSSCGQQRLWSDFLPFC